MESGERVDLRFDLEQLGNRHLRPIDIALEPQRSSEPKMRDPRPRVCGTRFDQQLY